MNYADERWLKVIAVALYILPIEEPAESARVDRDAIRDALELLILLAWWLPSLVLLKRGR